MVKVFDGIVLAADSATTLPLPGGAAQVYNNADKIFQLHRDLPIGAMTWGLGQIGGASISTLAKDLRRRLMGRDAAFGEWELDKDNYNVEQVASRMADLLHQLHASSYPQGGPTMTVGLLIAGYSAGSTHPEAWQLMIDGSPDPQPSLVAPRESFGWESYAQPEATVRLFQGYDPSLPGLVATVLDQAGQDALTPVVELLNRQPVVPSMPFPDAISFARYLVDVTVGYSHFVPGPDTVGGPVDVAGINRHEGFKWVSRKHYYTADLNRGDTDHA